MESTLTTLFHAYADQEKPPIIELLDINRKPVYGKKRIMTTGGHYAYMKIAEGCDKHCTYCIIPKIRGTFRSVPLEQLVEEAKVLVSQGVKELILVAQETTLYGVDLYGEKSLVNYSLCGKFNVYNTLAASTVAKLFGISVDNILLRCYNYPTLQ